ncbi:hypothetical protein [Flavilitoribacter nigricans]|uniref:Haem-binding domain-containing protein n=1 Tax=Flavilitoribacter nigricans (strain ATCC 23147 / DSM 23189 / NBRC 102662 / NCIMB 1420 / SS-2) TaxID=1122177 RepID=A0A2D0ND24_FLAN2|nr:hypothetical protein [Flavilitoribacter nigricans]PHN06411.1 hypothetical protein CRP01_12645 [Flavilitoribacter nigricans DSM 23189 = NBRC 102662]
MNKKLSIILSLALVFFLFQSSVSSAKDPMPAKFKYTKKVDELIHSKCYGCHSAEGRSDKAKKALMWDDIPKMTGADQAHILEEILDVTEERSMPPKGMVERKPELKLTDKEVATFQKWAKKMSKRVSK